MKRWNLLISALFMLSLASGCGKKDGTAKAEKSKNKDTYVDITMSDIDSLDPAWSYDTASHNIIANIYGFLVHYKGESITELEGEVAEKVPSRENGLISEDGLSYTFPIRKGVKFHEGGEVTAEDVRYSILRFILVDRAGGPSSLLLQPITGLSSTRKDNKLVEGLYQNAASRIIADGDKVVIKLHKPFAPILTVLASWAPVLDKEWCAAKGEWDGTEATLAKHNNPEKTDAYLHDHVNGTGPFKLDRWDVKGKEIVLARFDDYWRGPAPLKRAVFKGVDEFQTRKLMLAAGDADSIYADYIHQPLLQNVPGVEMIDDLPRIDMNPTIFFTFKIQSKGNPNVGSGKLDGNGIPGDFFSDIDVRKGFAHAFDYAGYIDDVNRGKGSRASSFIPKGLFGYDPEVPVYAYDLAKAEEHFKKAWGGQVWQKGFKFTIAYNQGNKPREVMATMIKRAIEAINPKFKVDTQVLQWSTYLDQSNASKLPMFIMGWAPDYPDPHNFAFPFMHSDGNYPRLQHYKNPKADDLVTRAMTETDPDKRRRLYAELQRLAYDDLPTIFVLNSVRFRTQRTWVKGFINNPVWPDSPYNSPLYHLSKT